ncbi:MAG: VWA domain-containing protein [Betaproteobacteria bacterium]
MPHRLRPGIVMFNPRSWTLVAALALLSPSALIPEPSALQQPQAPVFHAEANYVRVDAYPTKDGAPVADLTRDDFEVLDNGVPQTIDQFQHVIIQAAGPQETRREPNTVAESREMLNDPQARAFVVFLDTYHVTVGGSHNIRQPLIDALNRTIGEHDLVAVMTPEMSARDLTFARRTTTIEGMLTRYWPWGERDRINSKDPEEDQYWECYPGIGPTRVCPDDDRGVAAEMIQRRRERRTIDALNDLVRFMRGMREERTAVLVVSDGWLLFRPDQTLARRLYCQVPGTPTISVDPKTGRLTQGNPQSPTGAVMSTCETARMALAAIDDQSEFRRTLEAANRANVSFYPIDPRGLAVFDEPIAPALGPSVGTPAPLVPPSADSRLLAGRLDSLRTMAVDTDGVAVVNNNDLGAGIQRIVSDLTSYYLLGYYATGKLDGKYHRITVRVKRPGVEVRARRGYLAATEADVAAARAAAAAAEAPGGPTSVASNVIAASAAAAVARLAAIGRDEPFRIEAAAGWKPAAAGAPVPAFWIVGEVADRIPGADLDALVTDAAGQTVASGHGRIQPGTTGALVTVVPTAPLAPGEYAVSVRGQLPSGGSMASTKVALAAAPQASGAVFIRRGPATGNRDLPTADLRFRRGERLTVEVPSPAAATVGARLLDRNGVEVPVPVTAAIRDDPDGTRWATAQVGILPLAPGDYVVEITTRAGGAGESRALVAFRVIP